MADTEKAEQEQIETERQTESGAQSEPLSDEDALVMAGMATGAIKPMLSAVLKAPIEIDNETDARLAASTAQVIKKHCPDGQMPVWLAKWKEEIDFGMCLGGIVMGAIQEKKARAKAAAEAKRRQEGELAHGH